MASAPQPTLPLFYKDLMPLNTRDHAKWKSRPLADAGFMRNQHAVPLTVDEFVEAQRFYPIVFSSGENPTPLALFGLNEGVNTFIDDEGKITEAVYLPAYVRRYPFILAKLQRESEEMSLCFDPTSEALGEFDEGENLFNEAGEPSDQTKGILQFCERFEESGQRTKAFLDEIRKHDLLIDGEIAISRNEQPDKPFVYRGFQMISEEKLRELRGDTLRTWSQSGLLMPIYAHLFSLGLMRAIFARQIQQGKGPKEALENEG